jgi:hypothetical protein|tara:strand:- start:614 stop:1051 length:438 start_codon:yes stop_codon:yes gene_type:complete
MARRTAKQKAATRKLVALNKRRKSTRKGQRRVTARRAYMGLKRKTTRRRRKSTTLKRRTPKKRVKRGIKSIFGSSTLKKIALGVGGGAMAALAVSAIAPQFSNIAKPAGAYALGGIEGIVGSFALDMVASRTGASTSVGANGGTL